MTIRTGKVRPGSRGRTGAGRYYEVFGRKDSHDALTHLGSVEAPNPDLAQVRAWYVYDQHVWREMCVAPTDAFVSLNRPGQQTTIRAV
jgi:Phenylacetic acid degradation B